MFEYYGTSSAPPGIPVIQFIWLTIAALIGLAMVLDKNVLTFMALIPTIIRVQIMRLWFLIRFMPTFWLMRYTSKRRMEKMVVKLMAEKMERDLKAKAKITPTTPQKDEEID